MVHCKSWVLKMEYVLALEQIYGMLILWVHILCHLNDNVGMLFTGGGGGGGSRAPQDHQSYAPGSTLFCINIL